MMPTTDLFNPKHYAGVRKPLLEAETMPAWCYTSADFYRREVDRIWKKVWNFIGSMDQIPSRGDYFTLNFADVPIIILRDADGAIRAFANTCRHRGSELLEGKGNCKLIVCPYHSWTYDLTGNLRGAPEMEKTLDFDKAEYGLVPIKIDTWGGFLFISFDENARRSRSFLATCPTSSHPTAWKIWRWSGAKHSRWNVTGSYSWRTRKNPTTSPRCTARPSTNMPRQRPPAIGSKSRPANM